MEYVTHIDSQHLWTIQIWSVSIWKIWCYIIVLISRYEESVESVNQSSNLFKLMILTESQERLTELVVASTNSVNLSWLWVNLLQHFFFWDWIHWTQGWHLFQTHYHSGTSIERVTAWILKALSVSTQTRMSYELLQHCER